MRCASGLFGFQGQYAFAVPSFDGIPREGGTTNASSDTLAPASRKSLLPASQKGAVGCQGRSGGLDMPILRPGPKIDK
jgi:hypothetical protein